MQPAAAEGPRSGSGAGRGPAGNRWLEETGGTTGAEYAARFAALVAEGADVHGEARFLDALLAPGSDVVDAGCGTGRIAIELARRGHRTHGVDVDASMLDQARSAAPQLRWTLADLLDVELGAPVTGPGGRRGEDGLGVVDDEGGVDGSDDAGGVDGSDDAGGVDGAGGSDDAGGVDGAGGAGGGGGSGGADGWSGAGGAGGSDGSPACVGPGGHVGAGDPDGRVDLVVAAGNVVVYLTPGTEAAVVARLAGWLRPGGLLVVGFAADRHVSPADHGRWCAAAGLVPVAAHTAWDPAAPPPDATSDYAVLVHRRPHLTG